MSSPADATPPGRYHVAHYGKSRNFALYEGKNLLAVTLYKGAEQGSSWFPLHICGVKPTVSEELQFNQQVCGREAKYTLHTCETPRSYWPKPNT